MTFTAMCESLRGSISQRVNQLINLFITIWQLEGWIIQSDK